MLYLVCYHKQSSGEKWRLKPNTQRRQKGQAGASEQTTTTKPSQPVTTSRMALNVAAELTLRQQVRDVRMTVTTFNHCYV